MADSHSKLPTCPRCGSTQVKFCGQSVQYAPEEHAGQPLAERELVTVAYQCECGLGFTQTSRHTARKMKGSD